jgi:hypothetical protein
MKNSIKIIIALLFITTLSSCKKDLGEFTFGTTLHKVFPIEVSQTDGVAVSFDTNNAVVSMDNTDTHEYLENIKDVKVKSISFFFENFTGDTTGVVNATYFVDEVPFYTLTNINVANEVGASYSHKITDTTLLNQVATALKNHQEITAKYVGDVQCDEDMMRFDINATFELDITADVLK